MSDLPQAKKSLGQHWLMDQASLAAICEAAELSSDDAVLEIGPGPGTLTSLLVKRAKAVVAVEFDEALAQALPGRVGARNLTVKQQDILRFDLNPLPPNYKIVANIPYYLTSNLIRVISESANPPFVAVLLVQKEVARRVAARPGEMSLLSVTAQYYWQTSLGREVPAKLFTPPPKVDSQILILKRRQTPLFKGIDTQLFFRIVKSGFSSRRKTLLNSLSAGLRIDKNRAGGVLLQAGIDPNLRPQSLSLPQWYALYQAAKSQDIF